MKRWAIITVFLYALICAVAMVPLVWGLLYLDWRPDDPSSLHLVDEIVLFFAPEPLDRSDESLPLLGSVWIQWGGFIWLGVLTLCQALLLLVPLDIARERPVSRRRLWSPVLVGSFLFANVAFWTVYSLVVATHGSDAMEWGPGDLGLFYAWGTTVAIVWAVWGWFFYQFSKSEKDPRNVTRRITQWLLKGSILELLVAVPSHIAVRHRGECCAPMMTFWGIMTGLTVMLVSFGPGVFFLFAERVRRLRPRSKAALDSSAEAGESDN